MPSNVDVDTLDFLRKLGMQNIREQGQEVFYSCPFPGHNNGDVHPSASMKKGSTEFYCFGCGESGNAVTFLAKHEGISPAVAYDLIRREFGAGFKELKSTLGEEIEGILHPEKIDEPPSNLPIDPNWLDEFYINWKLVKMALSDGDEVSEPLEYMISRGFAWDLLREWQIGYDPHSNRITIPCFNLAGDLIGFKGRAWHPEQQPRYLVIGGRHYGFEPYSVGKALFGIDRIFDSEAYTSNQQLLVVEGELNTISMHYKGFDNAVSCGKKEISDVQAEMLVELADELVFIFDEEADALKAAEKVEGRTRSFIGAPHDRDPADSSRAEVESILVGKIPSLTAGVMWRAWRG